MNHELLLVFKTNSYLRTIDCRLGSPANNFMMVNDLTWKVYRDEILLQRRGQMTRMAYMKEYFNYYALKWLLLFYHFSVRVRASLGFKVTDQELQDF